MKTTKITDKKLLELCSHYGKLALHYRRKFIGLLPEVNRRRLFQKKGFNSIFEFAFKLAGLSKEQVQTALNLDRKFADKPKLHKLLTTGKISINKLARIVSVATIENQEFLADQVQLLPKSSIETLARDIKQNDPENCLPGQHARHAKGGECAFPELQSLNLSPKVISKLSKLKNKGIDINEMILNFLEKREQEIATIKEKLAKEQNTKIKSTPASRYIPAKIRHLVHEEHGTKCSIPNCQRPAKAIHHTARFAVIKNHNPYFLAPLCHEHHKIAHAIDSKFKHYAQTVCQV